MKEIPLSGKRGYSLYTIVDDDIYELIKGIKWSMDSTGYAQGRYLGKTIRLQNIVMGKSSRDQQIDHINRNKLDNRRINLRFVTHIENNNNKDTNVFLEAFNEIKTLSEWSRDSRCSVSLATIQYRLKQGYSPENAISKKSQLLDIDYEEIKKLVEQGLSFRKIAKIYNCGHHAISDRYKKISG